MKEKVFVEQRFACGRLLKRAFSPKLVGKGFTRNVKNPPLCGGMFICFFKTNRTNNFTRSLVEFLISFSKRKTLLEMRYTARGWQSRVSERFEWN